MSTLREERVRYVVSSATHVSVGLLPDARTHHSMYSIAVFSSADPSAKPEHERPLNDRVRMARVLIMDEYSMIGSRMFAHIERACRVSHQLHVLLLPYRAVAMREQRFIWW